MNSYQQNEKNQLFRVREVSERLGLSQRTIWRLIAREKIKVVRIGRSVRVPGTEVNRLITRGLR